MVLPFDIEWCRREQGVTCILTAKIPDLMQAFEQVKAGSGAAEEASSNELAGLTKRQRKNRRKRANIKAKRVGSSTEGAQEEASGEHLSLVARGGRGVRMSWACWKDSWSMYCTDASCSAVAITTREWAL